jgi:hypothetical protein
MELLLTERKPGAGKLASEECEDPRVGGSFGERAQNVDVDLFHRDHVRAHTIDCMSSRASSGRTLAILANTSR